MTRHHKTPEKVERRMAQIVALLTPEDARITRDDLCELLGVKRDVVIGDLERLLDRGVPLRVVGWVARGVGRKVGAWGVRTADFEDVPYPHPEVRKRYEPKPMVKRDPPVIKALPPVIPERHELFSMFGGM